MFSLLQCVAIVLNNSNFINNPDFSSLRRGHPAHTWWARRSPTMRLYRSCIQLFKRLNAHHALSGRRPFGTTQEGRGGPPSGGPKGEWMDKRVAPPHSPLAAPSNGMGVKGGTGTGNSHPISMDPWRWLGTKSGARLSPSSPLGWTLPPPQKGGGSQGQVFRRMEDLETRTGGKLPTGWTPHLPLL